MFNIVRSLLFKPIIRKILRINKRFYRTIIIPVLSVNDLKFTQLISFFSLFESKLMRKIKFTSN